MTKEEILTWALNNRCKYESSKEMDYDTHLAIMDAMRVYANEQTEKYKELIDVMDDFVQYGPFSLSEEEIMIRLKKVKQLKTELGL